MKFIKVIKSGNTVTWTQIFDDYIERLQYIKEQMSKISQEQVKENSELINKSLQELSSSTGHFYLLIGNLKLNNK